MAESFLSSLKKERIKEHTHEDRELVVLDIQENIQNFYNRTRRHDHLGEISTERVESEHKRNHRSVH